MKLSYTLIAVFAFGLSTQPFAQQVEHLMGDHPAVIVKRQESQQRYDYESKFYPHPAWMYLSAEAPHPMMDHPAVIIAKRKKDEARQDDVTHATAAVSASLH